jgi:hypothetical protein
MAINMPGSAQPPETGFTSVELAVAVLAAGILILAGGGMVIHAYQAWHAHVLTATVRRDAGHALDMMARHVRASSADALWADGEALFLVTNGETSSFARAGSALVYRPRAGNGNSVLVHDFVEAFVPRVNDRTVSWVLTLDGQDDGDTMLRGVAAWRNTP